jgi:UTP-glucose-1-phosphate uridylyltransferase
MQKPTLLILAAGMGSRYGGLKQLDEIGPQGETIIEYSVYDAIRYGFGKVVFVIRESFEEDFKAKITRHFADKIEVAFAYQAVNTPIEGIELNVAREKPWGTSHAVLVAEQLVNEPFAVINADDYYGATSMQQLAKFLTEDIAPDTYGMIGFVLDNTLSENGHVNRGICKVDEQGRLVTMVETLKIEREADGTVRCDSADGRQPLSNDTIVSMNMFAFHPSIFAFLKQGFREFVAANRDNPKAEYYIPLTVAQMIAAQKMQMLVVPSSERWYGVTYREDKPTVTDALRKLTEQGVYPNGLWA